MGLEVNHNNVGLRLVVEPHVPYFLMRSALQKKGDVRLAKGYLNGSADKLLYLTADRKTAKEITGADWEYYMGIWLPSRLPEVPDDLVGLVSAIYLDNMLYKTHNDCL